MVEFDVRIYAPIRRDLLELALATVAMVWQCRVGGDTRLTVVTVDRGRDMKGAVVDPNGAFEPVSRTIAFAVQQLLHQWPEKHWQFQMVRCAAHEAMHAVQFAQGDPRDRMPSLPPLGTAERNEHALEIEANQESVDVLKGYIPTLKGAMPYAEREYPVPTTSRYTEYWKQVREGRRYYVVVSETGPGVGATPRKIDG